MRVLFDPVYSAAPRRCSSAYKFKLLAERLIADHDDCWITWRIPDWSTDADLEWLPKDERVIVCTAPHAKTNRIHEYSLIRDDLRLQLEAYGPCWDTDMVVSMRTGMAQPMRMLMSSNRMRNADKAFVIMEEMAITTDRPHIGGVRGDLQDLSTLSGYLAADLTVITAGHVREGLIQTAKRLLNPSTVMKLRDKLRLVTPIQLMAFHTKPPRDNSPLQMLYSGRLNLSTSNTEVSFKALEAAFVMGGEDTPDLTVSTVTAAAKAPVPEFAEVQKNNREDFWKLLRDKADIAVYTTIDAEFSLTLIEPLCFGVPVMVIRKPWSEALIGPDYPFYVSGATEAYAFLKLFQEDYNGMYAQFLAWRDGPFADRFKPGGVYEHSLYDVIAVKAEEMADLYRAPAKEPSQFAKDLAEFVKPGVPFTMFDLLTAAYQAKKMDNHLTAKKWHTSSIPAALKADLMNARLGIKTLTGAKDHGPVHGWMQA